MRCLIVTGMSGAGKSICLKILEDLGYFCVDNLPIPLISRFAEMAFEHEKGVNEGDELDNIAIGIDIRSGHVLSELDNILDKLEREGRKCEILYLDASDTVLIRRFKETRRTHPLMIGGRVEQGIPVERKQLEFLKNRANYIIDTSTMLTKELRKELEKIFVENKNFKNLYINVVSFGFKYGIPTDSDLVFDVRFMPNPYYEPELKHKTGNDEEVRKFVMDSPSSVEFLEKLKDMVEFLIPNYIKEGKNQLVISIGCTGGKHRSVTVARALYESLQGDESYGLKLTHRNIESE